MQDRIKGHQTQCILRWWHSGYNELDWDEWYRSEDDEEPEETCIRFFKTVQINEFRYPISLNQMALRQWDLQE
jgi:hypothetical protein